MGEQVKAAGGFVGRRLGSVRIWRFGARRNRPPRRRKQQREPNYFQVSTLISTLSNKFETDWRFGRMYARGEPLGAAPHEPSKIQMTHHPMLAA
jgi:hypothetical protein